MTMGKKSLHLYHHFGNKTIFMQATNTYTIKMGHNFSQVTLGQGVAPVSLFKHRLGLQFSSFIFD